VVRPVSRRRLLECGLEGRALEEIEIRSVHLEPAKRALVRPTVVPWTSIGRFRGVKDL
jgi:hypothetical protein